jgi:hypothetical protein
MKNLIELIFAVVVIILLMIVAALAQRRPRTLKVEYFNQRWRDLQKLCKDKTTWPLSIIDADKLLDEALKKRHFKGKTMGERLVSAQHVITNNDGVWFGHKLRNRLVHEENVKLKQTDVKQALVGFRQALKDLGALK